jgi:predicted acyltransferase
MYFLGNQADPLSPNGNAALKLDLAVFGDNHLYPREGIAFDPEGLLSTLSGIANVIGGAMVGYFLQKKGKSHEALTKLLLEGLHCLLSLISGTFCFQSIRNYGQAHSLS